MLALPDISRGSVSIDSWAIALLLYTAFRTRQPIRFRSVNLRGVAPVIADVALHVVAVVWTGYWESPFVFSLITAVITAGFASGFGFAIRTALTAATSVTLPLVMLENPTSNQVRTAGEWSVELLLVALVAGYGRRLFGEAEERHSLTLDRMSRLAEANSLLFSLHRVAQTLPASLDLEEVLSSTMRRLRDLVDFDAAVLCLHDSATGTWTTGIAEGVRLPMSMHTEDLPPPMRRATALESALVIDDLFADETGPGISPFGRSGMYAGLRARGGLVGLVAVEQDEARGFPPRDLELFKGVMAPAALAIDNARWFSRLRTVGADEERLRIARDLHDRIGQSLAYLGFELDRLARRSDREPVRDGLIALREDVRQVVTEVRETLYDLRTDVTEHEDLVITMQQFLDRVRARSGLEIVLDVRGGDVRLPVRQERELLRIAQEAVTNAERHAQAKQVTVRWWCDGRTAQLVVRDDGRGLHVGSATRIDAYGMVGMRERADAIGAKIEVESAPGQGTTIRCRLEA